MQIDIFRKQQNKVRKELSKQNHDYETYKARIPQLKNKTKVFQINCKINLSTKFLKDSQDQNFLVNFLSLYYL